jgi:transposase
MFHSGQTQSSNEVCAMLADGVARLVGIECGVVSGVFNLESSGVRASDWRPRHDKRYHEA